MKQKAVFWLHMLRHLDDSNQICFHHTTPVDNKCPTIPSLVTKGWAVQQMSSVQSLSHRQEQGDSSIPSSLYWQGRWREHCMAIGTFSPVSSSSSNGLKMHVCVCLCINTDIVRNELMWICQRRAYFKFIPSTHILIPFEDREPTRLKVDIANCILRLGLGEDKAEDRQNKTRQVLLRCFISPRVGFCTKPCW